MLKLLTLGGGPLLHSAGLHLAADGGLHCADHALHKVIAAQADGLEAALRWVLIHL